MGLNESKGNMYSWVTHTWNTVKGECPHKCSYCYMRRFTQKKVRLDESEFKTDLGENNFIFVGSSCDMFAVAIPGNWILDTLGRCEAFVTNKYLFQSKNPGAFIELEGFFPSESVFATTIETNRHYSQMGEAPPVQERSKSMGYIDKLKYVTIEPIMDFDLREMVELIKKCNPVQVNIGADSGNNNLPEPSKEKLLALIDELQKFTVIDRKTNLKRLLC